jgi:hypothetical protein
MSASVQDDPSFNLPGAEEGDLLSVRGPDQNNDEDWLISVCGWSFLIQESKINLQIHQHMLSRLNGLVTVSLQLSLDTQLSYMLSSNPYTNPHFRKRLNATAQVPSKWWSFVEQ